MEPREGVFYVLTLFSMIRDEEGATALEYAVLVTAIVLALLAGATVFGLALQGFFETLFPL
jgi:Flp pilus assembly pilin Flp